VEMIQGKPEVHYKMKLGTGEVKRNVEKWWK